MLRLPPFKYASAATVAEAVQMLADAGPHAKVLAGGTDLLPLMKRRQYLPPVVIGLRRIRDLHGIGQDADYRVRIGAGCTLAEVAQHPLIRGGYPALPDALGMIASPAIRQMGTIGGNLCIETRCRFYDLPPLTRDACGHCLKDAGTICLAAPRSPRCWAVCASDAAPVLVSIDAQVRLVGMRWERVIPLRRLYRDDGLRPLAIRPGEILTEILLPPADGMRVQFHKMRVRGAIDFAAASVAAAVRWNADRTIADARIVVGGVASAPVIAEQAAQILIGRRPGPDVVADAARATAQAAKPLENADLTAAWRKRMVAVATERALNAVAAGP